MKSETNVFLAIVAGIALAAGLFLAGCNIGYAGGVVDGQIMANRAASK